MESYEKVIPDELVRATAQYFAHADMNQSREALKEFQEKQPAVIEFSTSLGRELSEEARNMLVYLSMVLWKIFDSAADGNFPKIEMEELEKSFEEMEDFFLKSEQMPEEEFLNKFQKEFPLRQPFVYEYLFQKLLNPEGESPWPEKELMLLFLALSSLLAVFSRKYEMLKSCSAGDSYSVAGSSVLQFKRRFARLFVHWFNPRSPSAVEVTVGWRFFALLRMTEKPGCRVAAEGGCTEAAVSIT